MLSGRGHERFDAGRQDERLAQGVGVDGESGTFTRVWDSLQYQVILERD